MEIAMQTGCPTRRRFLLSGTMFTAAGLVLAGSKARAFSEEQVDIETEGLAFGACQASGGGIPYHRQLLADIMATLQGKPQAEIDARIAVATCPLCGCSIG